MSKLITNTVRHVDGTADNITLDSSQNVTVEADLTIPDKIIHSGDTNTTIRFPAADTVSVETGGSERVRVDSSGRLLIGVTASTPTDNDANNVALQVEGTSGDTSRAMLRTNTTTAGDGSFLYLARSRGTSLGSKTSVSDDDSIGGLIFNGADGSDDTRAAGIQAFCDGTPGTDDMPGRLSFFTTPDGSGNYSERLRIDSSGNVTTPNQPCSFYVGLSNTATSNKLDTTETLVFNTNKRNEGSCYDNSNGRFTAPVAGTYFVGVNILIDTSATLASRSCDLQKNGSGYATICYHRSGGESRYEGMAGTGIIELAVNDYISIRGTSGIHTGAETGFTVYLLG